MSPAKKSAPVAAPATAPVAPAPAKEILVAFSAKGKENPFRPGSQREIWFTSLKCYEGKPLADWLKAVAAQPPKQRVKENHKSPHKGGMGFLRRFQLEGLLAPGVYRE
jgi:hypothetical protein